LRDTRMRRAGKATNSAVMALEMGVSHPRCLPAVWKRVATQVLPILYALRASVVTKVATWV
ncbi:MAG: hypothetical protein ACUVSL_00185, partial [Chloroflexus sp.]|uniref:hypothetical protein n=1 Tax=Chloroflexus sp. TaxID=1904827 RepID=UPI00404A5CF2